jgi:glutamate carboxypeptidase
LRPAGSREPAANRTPAATGLAMSAEQLRTAAAARASWMRECLAELVSCESPSAETAALARCAALLDDMGTEAFGRPAERLTAGGRPHLLWPAATPRHVLILGHFDTVWPLGTLADWPYTVTDGVASGPGVFDMKAGIIQALAAIMLLDRKDSVSLLLTSDEEVGSPSSRILIEDQARGAEAVLVCEPSADGGAVKIARKGVGGYQISIGGRAAHAGLEPQLGVNAGLELAHQVLALAGLADPGAGTTVTPTTLTAGTTMNTVPEAASVTVDVRAWTGAELERVDREIRLAAPRLAEAAVTVTGGINRYPLEPAAALRLFELARGAASDIGLEPPEGVRSGGGSDGNLTAAIGVPTLDGLGAVGGRPHARSEHTDVRLMPDRAALLAALIGRIRQAPAPLTGSG